MLSLSLWSAAASEDRKASFLALPRVEYSPSSHHISMLQAVVRDSSVANLLLRSYKRSFNGFAAKLTNEEAQRMASMNGVVSVFPSTTLQTLTTRSWDFMGFNETVSRVPAVESDTIIGVIDSGIWPKSASFNDEGFGPPPKKWKGVCKGGKNFTCNNKIIGARFYSSDSTENATDINGHGSHTASTAAGNIVKNTSFFGLGQGTARGAVPSARIAVYKACDGDGFCDATDILAAFDDAIADGVDVISISIGFIEAHAFHKDVIAIGAFHAMAKGVITSHGAGNNGLGGLRTMSSVAPWMISVAASTTDRKFIDKVVLGNGKTVDGFSINSFKLNGTKFPIVYGKEVTKNCSEDKANSLVKGKIMLCDQFVGNFAARLAGAVGSIMFNDWFENISNVVALPALALNKSNYGAVKSYIYSTKKPEAEILRTDVIEDASAPIVATFSSRGPNPIVPDILKPDLSAPGVNILAAYSPLATPASDDSDTRHVDYSIATGTSMACPHAAGVAAYVKTFHPDWSPSAIKSALMTTAWAMDQSKSQGGEFAYGSGHINPIKAKDPGLVYEALEEDYIKLLCSIGYTLDKIKAISGDNSSSCPPRSQYVPPKDLNYPSMTAIVPSKESFIVNFHRTVTNVGLANSTYKAQVSPNPSFKVEVIPDFLSFKSLQQKKSFNVSVTVQSLEPSSMVSASLIWSDGIHTINPWCGKLCWKLDCIKCHKLVFQKLISCTETQNNGKDYIVYMGALPRVEYSPSSHHISMLQDVVQSSSVANLLLRSYKRSFNGFAAKLTNEEAKRMASMKGVVSVFQSRTIHILTTRSWDFMGFNGTVSRIPAVESDTIIGVIDSGIWPKSASFQDEGFSPPPKKWKGVCKGGTNFTCNKKLIGARFYSSDSIKNATDDNGHGSHTASTVAGNKVKNASFFGLGQGIARGAVPSARIAAYKVCDRDGHCDTTNILAAFDDAIADGVDVISISIGYMNAHAFTMDVIAIGAFHAMAKGVITLNAAGNNGNDGLLTVSSVAPWMVSVAASTIDRKFVDKVVLGNGKTLNGLSINSFNLNGSKFPIIYGKQVTKICTLDQAMICWPDCLDRSLVKGKIVLCDRFGGNFAARLAGAVGSIMLNELYENLSAVVALPASALNKSNYAAVKSYQHSTKKPEAEILQSEVIEDATAPIVATFSSRGPNPIVPDILKPDLSAPGVNILAAYSPLGSPANDKSDTRHVDYNIVSGTSMACPHAAGVAAYVKTFHPDWSPSAIKSALMTTAWDMDQYKSVGGEFAYGSGHINPIKAKDPGLVYDALEEDYIKLLCSIGYTLDQIKAISGDNSSSCPPSSHNVPPKDLNYPSMTALVPPNESFTVNFLRTVTNVGLANSTYKAQVSPNPNLKVEVIPNILSFKSLQEKKSFNVTVTGKSLEEYSFRVSASLIWYDGIHTVRSPIIIHTPQEK
ncbi:hypothetical protein COLO4_30411 [Corchorus olitorius]|uniref:Peptidase S8/S53 domain-containing protein n=1 Tax=Corchorus olitorius TaxID=93759 RepID=A0A1R3H8Q2_9ROSI|nr:hypothetical protein COLO4_30411 [Corchorus olitorius]